MADEPAEKKVPMTDAPAEKATEAPRPSAPVRDPSRVVIRSYPKTVFFYPLLLTSLLCGILQPTGMFAESTLGFVYMMMFLFNMIVTSFEFRKHAPVVIALVLLIGILLFMMLNERFGIVGFVSDIYAAIHIIANPSLYFATALSLSLVFLGIFISTRYEYWEVRGNELLHHTGLLGDTERMPANTLRIKKEITDVFEFMLLRSGRIVLFPSGRDRPVVIENVLGVNDVAERMEAILDSLRVVVEPGGEA